MLTAPEVSVCIPTWNRASMLVDAVTSALVQTHRDLEVVVSDNWSTDGTAGVLADLAARDARVRVVRPAAHVPAYDNYRTCLLHARGRLVKFLNDDDVLLPDGLARMVPHLADPSVRLVTSRLQYMTANGHPHLPLPWVVEGEGRDLRVDGRQLADRCLRDRQNWMWCASTNLFRREDVPPERLARLGDHDFSYCGDYVTWLQLAADGQVAFVDSPVCAVRLHDEQGGQLSGNGPLEDLELVHVARLARRELGLLSDDAEYRQAIATATSRLLARSDIGTSGVWLAEVAATLACAASELADPPGRSRTVEASPATVVDPAPTPAIPAFEPQPDALRRLARIRTS